MKSENEITELLLRLHAGDISLDEVAERFRHRHWPRTTSQTPSDYAEMARRAQEDPPPWVPGSFDDVSAAYFSDEISEEQYLVLKEAALEGMRAQDRNSGGSG